MEKYIDFHVHPSDEMLWLRTYDGLAPAITKSEKVRMKLIKPIEEMAGIYRSQNTIGIILAWDAESGTGNPRYPNENIRDIVKKYPDVFIGFASVDPWKGKTAIKELDLAVKEYGLKGVKFHQGAQGFYPNDKRHYPLWEKICNLNIPIIFHTGTTGLGENLPGGCGIKLDHMKPIPYIDDVAADFPELKIVCAHVSWPWADEMLAVVKHKKNVYIDLSGTLPSTMPESWKNGIGGHLKSKFLFATDYPVVTPKEWIEDFKKMNFPEDIMDIVLIKNAKKILSLD